EHEQLRAIGWVVRTLHVMHPHNDGNGRLNINLLLQRLLQTNGFSPVITHSMSDLFSGGFSLDQIAIALRWSQGRDLTLGLDDLQGPERAALSLTPAVSDTRERTSPLPGPSRSVLH